jgi:hypothetical protein
MNPGTITTAYSAAAYVETIINYFPEVGGTTSYVIGSHEFFNRKFAPTKVEVQDTRGREGDFSLEKQGFQWIQHASKQGDFGDNGRIRSFYYRETEDLIRRR